MPTKSAIALYTMNFGHNFNFLYKINNAILVYKIEITLHSKSLH